MPTQKVICYQSIYFQSYIVYSARAESFRLLRIELHRNRMERRIKLKEEWMRTEELTPEFGTIRTYFDMINVALSKQH